MLNWSDSRSFGRTLAALSLFLSPLILLLATILGPDLGDEARDELSAIADDEGLYVISGILFLIAPLVFVPGMLGVIRLMRRRGVTLGQVGAAMIMLGALLTMAFFGWGAIEYVAATEEGLDPAQMAELFDAGMDSWIGAIIFVPGFLIGLVLGSILLAIALWRSGVVPVWSPIALVLSNVVQIAGGEEKWIAAVGFVLLFIAVLPVGQKILSISDDEWDRWQLPEKGGEAPPPATAGGPAAGGPPTGQ